MFAAEVFKIIASRLTGRATEIALFTETGDCFQTWCAWEAFAACREAGWTVQAHPSYAEVGLLGSRETADLLVLDPAQARQAMVEITIVHDWTTNRWIAALNRATGNLGRVMREDTEPLQIILATCHTAQIQPNKTWQQWLSMSTIWTQSTKMQRVKALGQAGQLILRGWVVTADG
jgi:hypothetical protein